MEAVRKVTDRFDMCDYFNASDLTITNSQIAKYIIENPELIHNNSLNALSGMSFFSESTLSRFFTRICGVSFREYLQNDTIRKYEFQKLIMSDCYTEAYINHIMPFRSLICVKDEILADIIDHLFQSKRILFVGPAALQGCSCLLSTVMLCNDKAPFSPYDYLTQQLLIEELNDEKDMLFIHAVTDNWSDIDMTNKFKTIISDSNARKILICTESKKAKTDCPSDVIILRDNIKAIEDTQLSLVYKILVLQYLRKFGFACH